MVTHMNYSATIAQQLNLGTRQVEKTIELLEQGATVPFIARYRKEVTGSLNEVQITSIMARECAKGGEGKDLDLMLYSGSCTIKAVYYEE